MARIPTEKPTKSDEREPQMLRARTSWPFAVVPSQCSGEGGWEPIPVMRLGSPGEMTGAKTAISRKRMRITIPATDLVLPDQAPKEPSAAALAGRGRCGLGLAVGAGRRAEIELGHRLGILCE